MSILQLEEILERSRQDHGSSYAGATSQAGPSTNRKIETMRDRIAELDQEIKGYDYEISQTQKMRSVRIDERRELEKEVERTSALAYGNGKGDAVKGIDYTRDTFPWAGMLRKRMKDVFKIDSFRLCQAG